MSDLEPPFRPREKILEKQKYFQNIPKHTYLKGPLDRVTSVAIPAALAATSLFLIVSYKSSYDLYCFRLFLMMYLLTLFYSFVSGSRDLQYVTWNRKERITSEFLIEEMGVLWIIQTEENFLNMYHVFSLLLCLVP
jgi:hypothetical protein